FRISLRLRLALSQLNVLLHVWHWVPVNYRIVPRQLPIAVGSGLLQPERKSSRNDEAVMHGQHRIALSCSSPKHSLHHAAIEILKSLPSLLKEAMCNGWMFLRVGFEVCCGIGSINPFRPHERPLRLFERLAVDAE